MEGGKEGRREGGEEERREGGKEGRRGGWDSLTGHHQTFVATFYHQVLQTGAELTELDSSGFATQAPTVFAGNLGSGEYIVQVGTWGRGSTSWVGTGGRESTSCR